MKTRKRQKVWRPTACSLEYRTIAPGRVNTNLLTNDFLWYKFLSKNFNGFEFSVNFYVFRKTICKTNKIKILRSRSTQDSIFLNFRRHI
jgi:hypothetical protein